MAFGHTVVSPSYESHPITGHNYKVKSDRHAVAYLTMDYNTKPLDTLNHVHKSTFRSRGKETQQDKALRQAPKSSEKMVNSLGRDEDMKIPSRTWVGV